MYLEGNEKAVSWNMSMLTVLNGKSEKAKGFVSEEGLVQDAGGRCHRVESIKVIPYGSALYSCTISFSYYLLR